MAKRKKIPPPPRSSPSPGALPVAEGAGDMSLAGDDQPTPRVQLIVSLIILAHFSALVFALSANLAPSYLQGWLARPLSAYLVTTNQAYNAFPLELTHAEAFDFPVYVELRAADDSGDRWHRLALPGIPNPSADSINWRFSRWPNFSRMVRLIVTDQPDNEILSDITARLVVVAEHQTGKTFRQVRWLAPKVLSYDDDARVASGQASLLSEGLDPTVMFSADILHDLTGRVSLVPQQIPLRTAKPVRQEGPRP